MLFKIATVLALAITAFATPTPPEACAESLAANNGDITFFTPGLGACGNTNGENDAIVAISATLYDSGNYCGKKIRVDHSGKTIDVTVVDRCAGCAEFDLDLSPSAFKTIVGDLGVGRTSAKWRFL